MLVCNVDIYMCNISTDQYLSVHIVLFDKIIYSDINTHHAMITYKELRYSINTS